MARARLTKTGDNTPPVLALTDWKNSQVEEQNMRDRWQRESHLQAEWLRLWPVLTPAERRGLHMGRMPATVGGRLLPVSIEESNLTLISRKLWVHPDLEDDEPMVQGMWKRLYRERTRLPVPQELGEWWWHAA